MKKLILLVCVLVLLVCPSGFARGAAGMEGVFVILDVVDLTPQGMTKHRIKEREMLKHIKGELKKHFRPGRALRISDIPASYPHLNINVTIDGDKEDRRYYITAEATLDQGGTVWTAKKTDWWNKDKNIAEVSGIKRDINRWERELKDDNLSHNEIRYSNYARRYFKNEVEDDKVALARAKKMLKEAVKKSRMAFTIKELLSGIASSFYSDYGR